MEYTGFLAAIFTTISFLPQVVKVLKTKDTNGISLVMYIMFIFGLLNWLIYGYYLNDFPMILSNAIALILSSLVLFYKIKDTLA